jgi:magnesium-transporting ATPase (P-type)
MMSTTQAYSGLNRPGWLTFAAVVLFSVGFLRIISALYYFADSTRVANLTAGAAGDHLFLWGLWDLLIALLALWGGFSLLSGNTFGRVVGYGWAMLVIIQSFLVIEYAPWFGFGALLLAILVIYALSASSDYRETPV